MSSVTLKGRWPLVHHLLWVTLVSLAVYGPCTAGEAVRVQILAINDLHGYISQTNEVQGRPVGGAAHLAAALQRRYQENPNTLLVHAGDMVGASPPCVLFTARRTYY